MSCKLLVKHGGTGLAALYRLQQQFGKPHPELEGFRPVPHEYQWLQSAFFRLHRRRPALPMGGLGPLTHHMIADFAERTLQIPFPLIPFFSRVMEDTDDAVLQAIQPPKKT